MGKNTDIESFDSSWNPVTGCKHECPYCYAKRIAERFAGYLSDDENRQKFAITGYKGQNIYTVYSPLTQVKKDGSTQVAPYPFGFAPTLYSYKLSIPMTWKDPADIFVCSMADLFGEFIPDEWIQSVFRACSDAPQHRYFFLTKNPERYSKLKEKGMLPKKDNFWYGSTITKAEDKYFGSYYKEGYHTFLSIEPIHEDIWRFLNVEDTIQGMIDWVIVGAETGNRVGKIKPKKEWIENVAEVCDNINIPLFMKDSLEKMMGDAFKQEKP